MPITVRTLDTPPAAAVDAWHDVVTAAHQHDLPAEIPPPGRAETAGKLQVPSARGRVVSFTATAPDGSYEGVASLLLHTDPGNEHTAFLSTLAVRPDARRQGVGAALWDAVRAELAADGRTSVATELEVGGAGEKFAGARGFENVLPITWYVQDTSLPRPDGELPAGYTFATWEGVVPDHLADASATAHGAMDDAPTGDVDEAPPVWNADKVRAAAQVILDRGGVMLTVAAVDSRGGDDTVAAYTELVLRDPSDVRALQYDTVVVPAHRGRGLGRAVKLRMLAQQQPHVRWIGTTVADENRPMLVVNEALGYGRERASGIFQTKI
ncbi:N-acetyltransferase [Streptomyces sp. ISL-100]|uniref:GNAT family N-acetyltransferase n=1 Tax=Streptomyces sp. ISL-100 TaxID=2819173 RepID=UPI001BE7A28D|nr:GNAT family N-acetyltransferase [Streptomyces sp. ISL-100]MBT2395869.1 GNAT family N-acetyltransferase [Streptomyces sp. ISL-100]